MRGIRGAELPELALSCKSPKFGLWDDGREEENHNKTMTKNPPRLVPWIALGLGWLFRIESWICNSGLESYIVPG